MSTPSATARSLTLAYYAHCTLLWQTPQGVRVLSDPYRNCHHRYWFTRQFSYVEGDLALHACPF